MIETRIPRLTLAKPFLSLGDSGLEVNLQDVTIPTALIYLEPPTIDFPVFAGEDDTSLWMLTNDTSGKYLLRVVETAPTPEGSKKIGSLGSLSVEKTEDNEVVFSFRGRCFPVEDQRVLALVSVIEDLGESVAKIHLSTDIKHAVLSYPSCSWIVIDEQRCKLPEEIMGFCVPGHKLGKPAVIYANESGVYRTCYSLKGHSCQATETEKLLSLDVSVYLSDYGANQHMCFLSQVDLCLFKSSAKAEYDMASVGYFEIHSADKSHQLDFDASRFLPSSKFGDRPRRVK